MRHSTSCQSPLLTARPLLSLPELLDPSNPSALVSLTSLSLPSLLSARNCGLGEEHDGGSVLRRGGSPGQGVFENAEGQRQAQTHAVQRNASGCVTPLQASYLSCRRCVAGEGAAREREM